MPAAVALSIPAIGVGSRIKLSKLLIIEKNACFLALTCCQSLARLSSREGKTACGVRRQGERGYKTCWAVFKSNAHFSIQAQPAQAFKVWLRRWLASLALGARHARPEPPLQLVAPHPSQHSHLRQRLPLQKALHERKPRRVVGDPDGRPASIPSRVCLNLGPRTLQVWGHVILACSSCVANVLLTCC